MTKLRQHPIFALVLCALLWSSGGFLIKSVDWNPIAITGVRSLIATVFMCIFLHRHPIFYIQSSVSAGRKAKIDKTATLNLWMGAICYCLTMILFVCANKITTAANAILLQYTNPIWIILFGPLLLGEKNRKSDYMAVLGVLVGMILFFSDGLEGGRLLGNIIGILSGVSMGFMSIFMRRQKNASPEDSFILSHILTFVISIPFCFGSPLQNAGVGIACLLALGIFQIGIPSLLYSIGISGEGALTSMLISMIEPVMNPVWVILIFHEVPTVGTIVGGIIILSTIILRAYIQRNKVSA